MNKRQKKKQQKGVILPKRIKDLVRRYSSLHKRQDTLGGVFGVHYEIDSDGVGENIVMYSTVTPHTESTILSACVELHRFVSQYNGEWDIEYTSGYSGYCSNYRFTKVVDKLSYYYEGSAYNNAYYVTQSGFDDNYSGTVYIPLMSGKFLAYDFSC